MLNTKSQRIMQSFTYFFKQIHYNRTFLLPMIYYRLFTAVQWSPIQINFNYPPRPQRSEGPYLRGNVSSPAAIVFCTKFET